MFATLRSPPQKSTAAPIAQARSPATEELSGGRREAAPEPVALRIFEAMEDMPQAFYDVTEEAEPRIPQMSAAKGQLDLFTRGLTEVLATIGEADQQAELRVFQVPALNFEALWINYEDEGRDLLIQGSFWAVPPPCT